MGSASSSHQSGRLKKILFGLRADSEEGRQVEALTQLCEMLSIGTEESLSTFSVDAFVPVLVGLLNHESNPDIMLLAARALTHLCDVLPSSCAAVVHYGAVSIFCARLLTIEYMDLAEQSLQALKKISQEHPTACLRAGALMAVLSYLDFFSTGVQRVALSTAANMCKKLPSDAADFVMEAVPLLTNLLQYHDSKVLEHASVCLTRIAEAFASSPDKLDELCNHGLVTQAASLISNSSSGGGQASLSTPTYTGLIRLLSTCASGSPLGAKTLLLLGISGILKDILSGSGVSSNASVSPALSRPPEQIYEIVNLANELLPPLPHGTISLPIISNMFLKGPIVRKSPAGSSGKQEDTNGNVPEISAREKLLNDQPELLKQFAMDLLPVLIQIYGSSVNGPVRHKCLSVIGKLMYFSTAEMIQSLLSVTNVSSFLAGVLAWKDPHVLVPALKIAEILMEKLPGTFSKMFIREGVVHAVDQLILAGNSTINTSIRLSVSTAAKAFKDKYFPSDPGAAEVGITEDLLHLKNLCMKLNAGADDHRTNGKGKSKTSGFGQEEYLIGVIADMLKELGKGDGVSTFEFIGSGVVAALLNYFSCGYFSKDRPSETHLPKLRQQALTRFKLFIAVALPSSTEYGTVTPMSVLVQKLQNALSSLERFPVVLSHSSRSSSGSARLSSGLSALSQPFKLRLCRAQGDKSLRDYSSNVVLVDPLASLAAIEEFLWPRIQRSESGQKSTVPAGNSESGTTPAGAGVSSPSTTRRHSTRSRSSVNIGDTSRKEIAQDKSTSSSKGKGKAVLKPAQEEARGPQTRNATRRRAALDKDAQINPVNGDSTSEDEDLDISPVEIDEALVIEDDDISDDEDDDDQEDVLRDDSLPVCSPDKVHDVKLGDLAEESAVAPATSDGPTNAASGSSSKAGTVRGSDSADFRSGYTSSSRGAMSFAAAAMAGLGSANSRGFRGGRDRLGRPLFGSSNDPPKLIFTANELSVTSSARVPAEEFISSKLTPKLARQIQDALALCSGSLPSWCYQLTKACPFLFPFETRRQYFYSTAFGLSRALYRLQQQQGADGHGLTNEREIRVGRLQRQKVRVSRNRILDSAAKVMELYSSQKAVLEVEYFGEVGTGLGPTLEFYTLLSHDLQKVVHQMWRSGSFVGDGELVQAPLGLFPRPWPANVDASEGTQFSKVIEYFRLLGRVMAKALQDGRLLDLPLSMALYKLILGQELDLHDILFIDAELGKTLQEFNALVCRKRYIESIGGSDTDTIANLHFRGAPIEDICLDFTLPGYPDYILKPGDKIVDINNLEEYISMVVDATVKTGIMRQMEGFRAGFNQVFDISSLQIFTPQELDYLLCGRRELWKTETLADHIKFDHGYTAKSPAIVNLLEIMGEFTPEQQRAFCQFVTGAPRLPPGGLAVLNPKLTIVRKLSSSAANVSSNGNGPSESADDDLPSVMTCANYLKLPPYSTKEIMYKKLLYAINEGQGSFDLS
uniref:HECT-type E3 ubiquitin transferase n=1 Tax=Cajanus cajan TaxID=3821 RepID=A0A151TMN3_CAJCA|nr:E3 ubiquitin-protein ligase UPL3 [Cajanus cajan]